MRYYNLTVTPPGGQPRVWTSYPGNIPDPQAQNIIFDVISAPFATPSGAQTIKVEGISLADLTQAQQFAGADLALSIGMGGGLPLENPSQIGPIAKGLVFQSFGNWIGTDMTLDFVVIPGYFSTRNPGKFTLVWPKGQPLGPALLSCLQNAYNGTGISASVTVSPSVVAPEPIQHHATTLESLASWLAQFTAKATNGPVQITSQNGTILAFDNTLTGTVHQIAYTDLIGQPTWIQTNTMQMKLVARGDIQIGDSVFLPSGYLTNAPGAVTTTASSYPSTLRYQSTFTQGFNVLQVRHVGGFRSSDGGEWATIINAVVNHG